MRILFQALNNGAKSSGFRGFFSYNAPVQWAVGLFARNIYPWARAFGHYTPEYAPRKTRTTLLQKVGYPGQTWRKFRLHRIRFPADRARLRFSIREKYVTPNDIGESLRLVPRDPAVGVL